MSSTKEQTKCYTYNVEMIVQVLAKDLSDAAGKINSIGGHVTSRTVNLISTTDLPNDINKK
jgi:hypothetical protein